ncbi:MAG: tetrathionate reductase family octaheme c-type cytochrome [Rhodocyclaceae bacterium]|nr:tetrathionate reductase family octaheme c-type cytochrome [Rhodocyclaceae bacterium]
MLRTRSAVALFAGALLGAVLTVTNLAQATVAPQAKPSTTADHSKFKELQKQFKTGPEVTKACLVCHTEAAKQVHRTKHWTWEFINTEKNQKLGKKNVLNNFCISIPQNQQYCTNCHVGYGWKDKNFDFTSEENVDCLVCHDTTLTYVKQPGMAGHVVGEEMEFPKGSGKILKPINLSKIAQGVGKSSRETCGNCHFFGGGGDGVKHGDLDSSLFAPEKDVDVHMAVDGLNFNCGTCHQTSSHDVPGSRYTPTAKDKGGAQIRGKSEGENPATCVACHDTKPHKAEKSKHAARLNVHAEKLACQTCHIPAFARGGVATKMSWDWSTAGQMDAEGKPIVKKDDHGNTLYESRKGDFVVAENVKPEYYWFNGGITYTLLGDKIEKGDKPVGINKIEGSATDGKSMIWPFKVSRGKQPYDPENHTLITPHTTGPKSGGGYWTNYDWDRAARQGMADAGAPFSGKIDFVSTEMYWPIAHMVAPKDKSVGCAECHAKDGRLAGIKGIYIPGRDANPLIDKAAWLLALLTLLGVLGHAAIRIFASKKH